MQISMFNINHIKKAIDRLIAHEPVDGYYLAFSGGKDSIVIYKLAELAGVKFRANYNVTGIDYPELYYFIKEYYPTVKFNMYEKSMWKLIEEKLIPPTRLMRYCCDWLKERGGEGQFVITGVRWAESKKRQSRGAIENFHKNKKYRLYTNDNEEWRRMSENCIKKGKFILNPIIDWADEQVWNFIKDEKLKYCKLYDCGFKRLGCIGCPLAGAKQQIREFKKYPKFKKLYLMAFEKMLKNRKARNLETQWETPNDVFNWWIYSKKKKNIILKNQISMLEKGD